MLFWLHNNNLYRSNNYETAQQVENNYDKDNQISIDLL